MVIKNAVIFENGEEKRVDVKIIDGKIEEISPKITTLGDEFIDAEGLYLFPSIVDLNVRLYNDKLNRKNLDRLFENALKGGIGTFVLMPDFSPKIDNETILEFLNARISEESKIRTFLSIAASRDGERLNNISTLLKYGSDVLFENSSANGNIIRRAMQYAKMKEIPFMIFCNNPDLNDSGVMNESEVSFKLGLAGISKISEISEAAKIAEMAVYYGIKLIFQSLSTARSIEIANDAKSRNEKIFCEVSIHHLVKNDSSCEGFNTAAKLMPPLRDEEEREKLLEALMDDKIDVLTALHSPKSVLYKDVAFADAKYGIDSIRDFLPLCYTYLVRENIIDFEKLFEKISLNPSKILNLKDRGAVKEGYRADLILFNPSYKEIKEDKTSLYYKDTIYGKVEKVIVNGEIL
ncbi:MAG: amidohydrolase family protein [Epsilonproteobacteria bacterium]|nr:amidohydrolase family protein [Campylobacterota bacterium]